MKMDNSHEFYNGLCCGCNAAVKQVDIDPDYTYTQCLCGRCLAELETLPPRHQVVFTRLQRKMKAVLSEAKHRAETIKVLEGYIMAHGLNPGDADDSYAADPLAPTQAMDQASRDDAVNTDGDTIDDIRAAWTGPGSVEMECKITGWQGLGRSDMIKGDVTGLRIANKHTEDQ